MKSFAQVALSAFIAAAAFATMPSTRAANEDRVIVNGHAIAMKAAPVLVGDAYMMPVRLLSEYLGCTVRWDAGKQQATITPSETPEGGKITVTVGQGSAIIEGRERTLLSAPVIRNGQLLLPLRDLAGFLHARVAYDPDLRLLSIHLPSRSKAEPVTADYFAREWV